MERADFFHVGLNQEIIGGIKKLQFVQGQIL